MVMGRTGVGSRQVLSGPNTWTGVGSRQMLVVQTRTGVGSRHALVTQ